MRALTYADLPEDPFKQEREEMAKQCGMEPRDSPCGKCIWYEASQVRNGVCRAPLPKYVDAPDYMHVPPLMDPFDVRDCDTFLSVRSIHDSMVGQLLCRARSVTKLEINYPCDPLEVEEEGAEAE